MHQFYVQDADPKPRPKSRSPSPNAATATANTNNAGLARPSVTVPLPIPGPNALPTPPRQSSLAAPPSNLQRGDSKPQWTKSDVVEPVFPERPPNAPSPSSSPASSATPALTPASSSSSVQPATASTVGSSAATAAILSPTPQHPSPASSTASPASANANSASPSLLQPPTPSASSGRSSAELVRETDMDIFMASRHGKLDRVKFLLDKKLAGPNDQDPNYNGVSPLHWASLHDHNDVVKLLVNRGADPNRRAGNPSASALHWAARAGAVDSMKTMRNAGGNPKLPDGQGYNCLHLAVHGNQPKMTLHLLADAGMDVDAEDPMGRTPLIWAAYLGSSLDVVDILLKRKARVNLPDALKFTPLHWAVGTNHYEIVKRLLLAGADPNARDRDGKTPADRAKDLGTGATYEATLKVVGNRLEREKEQSFHAPTPQSTGQRVAAVPMPLRTFRLANGANVPCVGLGTAWNKSLMDAEKIAVTIQTAIELGYRHFDSAQFYHNEKEVGDALAAVFAKGQITREMIFHSSKVWNTHHRPANVRAAFEQSLKDLRYEYLDLYLLHWPISFLGPPDVQGVDIPKGPMGEVWLDAEVDLAETWKEMEKLVDEGKCKAIGVCNFPLGKLKWLLDLARIKPAVHQYETHPYLPQPELLSFCRKNEIVVMAYAPLGINNLLSDPTIKSIAEKYSVDPAKVLISRAVQRGTCVVLRSENAKHMADNLSLIKLDQEDLELLGTMKTRARYISPLELFGIDLFGESEKGYEETPAPAKPLVQANSVHLAI